jgi:hypothetical protein
MRGYGYDSPRRVHESVLADRRKIGDWRVAGLEDDPTGDLESNLSVQLTVHQTNNFVVFTRPRGFLCP